MCRFGSPAEVNPGYEPKVDEQPPRESRSEWEERQSRDLAALKERMERLERLAAAQGGDTIVIHPDGSFTGPRPLTMGADLKGGGY